MPTHRAAERYEVSNIVRNPLLTPMQAAVVQKVLSYATA